MRCAIGIPAFLAAATSVAAAGLPPGYGNGKTDATAALQAAVNSTPSGGALAIAPGHYLLTGTIAITKPITLSGTGLGTQFYERADQTLLRLTGVNGAVIRDLYLGSNAVSAGMSLIELVNSNHNRIDDVTMLGGPTGLHLRGSLLNTIVDLRSGTNFGGFFGATSQTQFWVYGEPFNTYSANANTFVAPVLEGGVNGVSLNDGNGQGSLTILGGTIEGVSGTALAFNTTFLPSSVTGLHMESNGGADIAINGSSNVTLTGLSSLSPIVLSGDTRNVVVSGGIVETMTIGAATKRIRVENVTTALKACSDGIVNANGGTASDGTPNVILAQIGNYCGGQ